MHLFTRLPRWLAGALLLLVWAAPVPAKAFAPLVVFGLAAGAASVIGGSIALNSYDHERDPLVVTPVAPLPPMDRTVTVGPRPAHTYTPIRVTNKKAAPKAVKKPSPAPLVPPSAVPMIIPPRPAAVPDAPLVPAPEELHPAAPTPPRVILPAPMEPTKKLEAAPVKEGWLHWILMDLVYTAVILGALGIIVSAVKKVIAIRKGATA